MGGEGVDVSERARSQRISLSEQEGGNQIIESFAIGDDASREGCMPA